MLSAAPELVNDKVVMKDSKRRAEGRVFEMTCQAGKSSKNESHSVWVAALCVGGE